ncbi:MAG: TetR/AcrR family transcriptional regulator [Deltaproteobacteria bacterium]|nr:TetR/AcrR family transcriptional regulator [Deltaproteobacteria bacterium]
MGTGWLREEQPDVAVDRILDAADKIFAEIGVSAAGMSQIAEAAGCSRGTLYRYFENRHQLHVAYVDRASSQIVERVRESVGRIADPQQRLVEFILGSVREVRANPATAAWFEPGVSGLAARMGRSSEVTGALTAAFVARLFGSAGDDAEGEMRARWFVRIVISLLGMPEESDEAERTLVERFVAPAFFG